MSKKKSQESKPSIYMTEQWKCPQCKFPENFLPTCALCGYENPKAKPESEKQRKKMSGR